MKVQFKITHFYGTRTYAAKEIGDVPDNRAAALIKAGVAVPVKEVAPIETATIQPPIEIATKAK